jgi:hypothetical protein
VDGLAYIQIDAEVAFKRLAVWIDGQLDDVFLRNDVIRKSKLPRRERPDI